mgnify:CR=1 FL=1
MENKYLTIIDYASKNKVTRQTIYNWIKTGKIKPIKIGSQQLIKIE